MVPFFLKEIQRLQKLYDEVEEDNIDLESDPESDRCEESDHNTDSEEELEEKLGEELATPKYSEATMENSLLLIVQKMGYPGENMRHQKKSEQEVAK